MATIPTKVDVDNWTKQSPFKTLAKIVKELNVKIVKDDKHKPHAVSAYVEQSQYYVSSSKDRISYDADGYPSF